MLFEWFLFWLTAYIIFIYLFVKQFYYEIQVFYFVYCVSSNWCFTL